MDEMDEMDGMEYRQLIISRWIVGLYKLLYTVALSTFCSVEAISQDWTAAKLSLFVKFPTDKLYLCPLETS